MAKKYLLYIHDERFANEARKSELVNTLLRLHYAGGVGLMVAAKAANPGPAPRVKPDKVWPRCPRHHVPMNLCKKQH